MMKGGHGRIITLIGVHLSMTMHSNSVCVYDSYMSGTDVESDSLAPGRYTLN